MEKSEFQYISCCSLSECRENFGCHPMLFQYISCCSLSGLGEGFDLLVVEFQYISCCSLSSFPLSYSIPSLDFNTSHVVVYLLRQDLLQLALDYFNTSHVVVYRKKIWENDILALEFQYISCCSSSEYTVEYWEEQ